MNKCPGCGSSQATINTHCSICGGAIGETARAVPSAAAVQRTNYGDARYKICPRCRAHHPLAAPRCSCGHRFVSDFPDLRTQQPAPPTQTPQTPAQTPQPATATGRGASGFMWIFAAIGFMVVASVGAILLIAFLGSVLPRMGRHTAPENIRADGRFALDMTTREAGYYLKPGLTRKDMYAVFGDPATHGYQADIWQFRDGYIEVVYESDGRYAFHQSARDHSEFAPPPRQ